MFGGNINTAGANMKYITGTLDFALNKRSAITLGKFDGLHRGHNKLVDRILKTGKDGFETVIFTFDVSPTVRLQNAGFRALLTNEERKERVEEKGVDCLIECPFVQEIMHMEPEDFIKEVLVNQLKAAYIIVGPDFHFGHDRKGNPQMLKDFGLRYNYRVEILDKVMDEARAVSSTYIREEILNGNIEKANDLLGYPYFVTETVVRGRQLGRTIGMPTINIVPSEYKLLPPYGVYTSRTYINGTVYEGVSNIGVKPTVGSNQTGVETFLFECNENLYDMEAKVEFYHYQRPEIKFDSIEALKQQIHRDEHQARQYFA